MHPELGWGNMLIGGGLQTGKLRPGPVGHRSGRDVGKLTWARVAERRPLKHQ